MSKFVYKVVEFMGRRRRGEGRGEITKVETSSAAENISTISISCFKRDEVESGGVTFICSVKCFFVGVYLGAF